MSLAQPKSGELLDLLGPSLTHGKNLLSEFEIHIIIREAKKIPVYYQSLSVQGLAKLISGQIDEGIALCEESLKLAPEDSVSFCNYMVALRNKGYHVKQFEMIKNAVSSHNPRILSEVAINAAYWMDIDLLRKVIPVLEAMEIVKADMLSKSIETLDYLNENEEHAKDFKSIAKIMMEITEKHRLRLAASNAFYDMDDLNTFFVEVKTDDSVLLSKVNDELADEILAMGLENSECIGCFQVGEL